MKTNLQMQVIDEIMQNHSRQICDLQMKIDSQKKAINFLSKKIDNEKKSIKELKEKNLLILDVKFTKKQIEVINGVLGKSAGEQLKNMEISTAQLSSFKRELKRLVDLQKHDKRFIGAIVRSKRIIKDRLNDLFRD